MRPPKRYVEDHRHRFPPPVFMEEEAYAKAIASLVVVCTDVGIVDRDTRTLYLARRKSRPGKGLWWFIGGRMHVGEPELDSAVRCFHRETGLRIDPERLEFVSMNRYLLKDRKQEPTDIGSDSLAYTFAFEPTARQRTQIALDGEEYEPGGLRAFRWKDLQNDPDIWYPINDFYRNVFPS